MDGYKIFHNARWGKSRAALQLLRDSNIEPVIINYLNDPLDEIELRSIAKKLNLPPSAWVRKTEKQFKDNKIHNIIHDDDKLYEAMCKYPKIIERPIIIRREKAIIGRPPENIYQLI